MDAQLCLATSLDLIHWERKGVILPAYKGNWNIGWTKSGAIVPEKIDGKYWMYWLGTAADKTDQMGLSYSSDLLHWTEATQLRFSRAALENLIPASSSPARRRFSPRAASSSFTTVPTTSSSIALALPFS